MRVFQKPIVTNFENNAMLVRMSRQNLAEWKLEKASWVSHIKKKHEKIKLRSEIREFVIIKKLKLKINNVFLNENYKNNNKSL